MLRSQNIDAGLEVVPGAGLHVDDRYDGLEAIRDKPGNDLEVVGYRKTEDTHPQYTPLEATGDGLYVGTHPQDTKRHRFRKSWYIWAGVILLLVIIAVLGGVLGSRAHNESTPAVAAPLPVATPKPTPTASSVSTANRLAAIAWGIDDQRLYYQNEETLQIRESSFNGGNSWLVTNLSIGVARDKSPIAAAVRGSSAGLALHLFAVNASGQVVDWSSTDGIRWDNGSLADHGIRPANFSNLGASYSGELGNSSLVFVYQDEQAKIQVCNLTLDSWTFSTVGANAVAGSGIALNQVPQLQFVDQQRLFYQLESGDLVAADWVSEAQIDAADIPGKLVGWNLNEKSPLMNFEMLAPLTSFAWGGSGSTDYVSTYGEVSETSNVIDVLASGSTGLTEVPWYVSAGLGYNSSTKPEAFAGVQNYTSLSSHAWGSAFAMSADGSVVEYTFTFNLDVAPSLAWVASALVPTT